MLSTQSFLLVLLACVGVSHAADILCLGTSPSRSHYIVMDVLFQELVRRGHHITFVSSFRPQVPLKNYDVIDLGSSITKDRESLDYFSLRKASPKNQGKFANDMITNNTKSVLENKNVIELLESDKNFDLIIADVFMSEPIVAGIVAKYQVPYIVFMTTMTNSVIDQLVGNESPLSYIPSAFTKINYPMKLYDRFFNAFIETYFTYFFRYNMMKLNDELLHKYFDNLTETSCAEILSNVSLVLINHHHSLSHPRPYVPNMIEVGGIHVKQPEPLPQDLQAMLDQTNEGVIFFSLGSNVKSSMMPENKLSAFLNVFKKLNVKVLWKWDKDDLPGRPDNVILSKWFPQSDILAHPNVKLFITHGGLLSTTEAVYRGVPVLGIPMLGDQFVNMNHAERLNFGKQLNFEDITEDNLYESIAELLNNTKYRDNVKIRQQYVKDNPVEVLESAVFWVEYVLRHNGAYHLRSSATNLSWYQRYNLDVYIFLFFITGVFVYVLMSGVKVILRLFQRMHVEKHLKTQ